ncbi:hypothetical protein SprV_0802599900 [Sparganum proliferum]
MVGRLSCLLQGVNRRLVSLRLSLWRSYSPSPLFLPSPSKKTSSDEAKNTFYEDQRVILSTVPMSNKLVVLADCNVRVGTYCATWGALLGDHGFGSCNNNGLLLQRTYEEHRQHPLPLQEVEEGYLDAPLKRAARSC